MDGFNELFGAARGRDASPMQAHSDGRQAPMTRAQVLATIKFLAPEVAQRAAAHTKAWREGPPAAWVIAYLCYKAQRPTTFRDWWRGLTAEDWCEYGLRGRPSLEETERFIADVEGRLGKAPTTVLCLSQLIADLARCGSLPLLASTRQR